MTEEPSLSRSGSPMVPAGKLTPGRLEMPPVINLAIARVVMRTVWREVGFLAGSWILLRSVTWDMLLHRPRLKPEQFEISGPEEERHFRKVLGEIAPLITIFDNLKRWYGEERADRITAKMAIPIALTYLVVTYRPGTRIETIDEMRQLNADYLGSGLGFEWTEHVSEDGTEVRYRFTKCVYIMLLRAYGLISFAGYSCLADHVIFDNVMPDIVFGRNHTLGVGDTYCDHCMRLRTPDDVEEDEGNYGDCHKVRYGGRDEVRRWAKVYEKSGPSFRE